MRKLLLLAFLLCAASVAHAQAVRYDSQVNQTATVAGVPNVVTVPPNPIIAVCNHPANAVPCTNKATTYTSATLATPCSTSTQIVLAGTSSCVANPDAQGNWGVFVAAGAAYDYTITLAGVNFGPYYITQGNLLISGPYYAVGGGTAQSQVVSTTPPLLTLSNGIQVCWLPVANNTGPGVTLAGGGSSTFPAANVFKNPNGNTALVANDLVSTTPACAIVQGGSFVLQNPQTNILSSGLSITPASVNGVIYVDGIKYPQTNAGIQAAINATPVGGTVFLPEATYALTATSGQQLLVTQPINIVCAGWGSNLQLQAGAGSIPLLRIAPSGASGYVDFGTRIQDCQFSTASAGLGTYAIQIDISTTGSISNLVIDHIFAGCTNTGLYQCVLGSGFGTGSIFVNNPTGTGGMYHSGIYRSTLYGNMSLTRQGDATELVDNKFFENATSDQVYVDAYPGSAELSVLRNVFWIPLHFGAVTAGSVAAIEPDIEGNQFEPQNASLTGSNGAMLDLDGSASSTVLSASIAKNTFLMQSAPTTMNAIRLNYALNTEIGGRARQNYFTIDTGGSCGATTCHGIITTANTTGTNWVNRNTYSTTTWVGSAGSILDDVGTAAIITDDAFANPAAALIGQASSGGTNIYGINGIAFQGLGGANVITDGSPSANNVAVFANAPNTNVNAGSVETVSGEAFKEATAPSTSAPYDTCYGDSTLQMKKCSYHNGTFFPVPLTGNVNGTHSDSGFYQTGTAAGCTTGASIGGTCASATSISWPTAFADTNYKVTCTGQGAITNFPIISSYTITSGSAITVQTMALTAAAASFANISCMAVHN